MSTCAYSAARTDPCAAASPRGDEPPGHVLRAGARVAGSGARIPDLEGDFSLNAANAVAAGRLLDAGLGRLAPTHDLSGVQLAGLARGLGGRWALNPRGFARRVKTPPATSGAASRPGARPGRQVGDRVCSQG